MVRVVGDEHVALAELVDAEELEREAHRQRRREHELRDADRQRGEAARRVEDRRVALVRLVEDRRGRGARHVLRHLEADGLHAAADDLGGDGIDGVRRRRAGPASGQANEIDVGHGVPHWTRRWIENLTSVSDSVTPATGHWNVRLRPRRRAGRRCGRGASSWCRAGPRRRSPAAGRGAGRAPTCSRCRRGSGCRPSGCGGPPRRRRPWPSGTRACGRRSPASQVIARVLHRRGRALERERHVGELVLDRLERADRPVELLALLRVRERHVEDAARGADHLGRDRHVRAVAPRRERRRGRSAARSTSRSARVELEHAAREVDGGRRSAAGRATSAVSTTATHRAGPDDARCARRGRLRARTGSSDRRGTRRCRSSSPSPPVSDVNSAVARNGPGAAT